MPEILREVLYSPAYGETILQIAKDHHLDEVKTEAVMRLSGFVIYGFIHPEELDDKIVEEIGVDKTTAREVAEEIDKKVFEEFRKELAGMYSPVSETAGQVESIRKPAGTETQIEGIKITEGKKEKPEEEKGPEIRRYGILAPEPGEGAEEKKTDEPFIIHRESGKPAAEEVGEIKERKSFQLGDLFGKETKKEDAPSVKIKAPKDKDTKKTVHYSEYRTSAQPGKRDGNGFITMPNPTKPEKKPEVKPAEKIVPQKSEIKPPKAEVKKEEPKKTDSGPSVEGNTIDLRNL